MTDDPSPLGRPSGAHDPQPAAAGGLPPRPFGAAEPDTGLTESDVEDDVDGSLLALVDRLTGMLDRSDLSELEVESGGTSVVLRKRSALYPAPAEAGPPEQSQPASEGAVPPEVAAAAVSSPSVKAPLTGIFYASPSPGSPPYVRVEGEVAVGQIIGLIEAMKLFNEIKSDLAGRVVRVVAESGQLVKAKQPLIEVEPL